MPPNVLNPTEDDLRPLIIEVGCGLRPAREGGIRLEVEWVAADKQGKKVPVVFNYGYVVTITQFVCGDVTGLTV